VEGKARRGKKKRKKIYDNDNNIKPIEVNFNNNEYIIFSLSLAVL
jgi:hypothetical protein